MLRYLLVVTFALLLLTACSDPVSPERLQLAINAGRDRDEPPGCHWYNALFVAFVDRGRRIPWDDAVEGINSKNWPGTPFTKRELQAAYKECRSRARS